MTAATKMGTIDASEFKERLAALCRGTDTGLPRKQRDRHILFRSIVQTLGAAGSYSEPALNDALREWASGIGAGVGVDHVTLRRYLVDAGYLGRDPGGTIYQVHPEGRREVEFGPEVSSVDSSSVVREAQEDAAARKRKRMKLEGQES